MSPPTSLRQILDGEKTESIRQKVREILNRPEFVEPHYLKPNVGDETFSLDESQYAQHISGTGGGEAAITTLSEYRNTVYKWLSHLAKEQLGLLLVPKQYGGGEDFAAFVGAAEIIAFHDISLAIKSAVQFSLWGGSIYQLGTARHHAKYLERIGKLELPGCFAMTEIGHGSDVRDIETTARFDAAKNEFVIHSPTFTSGKNYIGNAACHGRMATVFAQLEVEGKFHGVHAFVVPIRDEKGNVLNGITIHDNGPKMGENGVDNGRIWFNQIRVPKENLLDRFAQIDEQGNYHSPIENASERFIAMLSTLVGGRILIATVGLSAAKSGLAVAVRYGVFRRQFKASMKDAQEMRLMDYPTHQRRLIPFIANVYALHFALKDLSEMYVRDSKEVEVLAAGLKAATTWNTTAALQNCREACGGEGYMVANRLPSLKADSDVFTTFEGDNTVLTVWVGRNLYNHPPHEIAEGHAQWNEELRGYELKMWKEPAVQVKAFLYRAQTLWRELKEQSDYLQNQKVEKSKIQLQLQWQFFHFAQAYIEYHVLKCFVKSAQLYSEQPLLHSLQQLYAFSLLEKHRAWFLEREGMSAKISKMLHQEVDLLCAQLTPSVVELVDAFGIPETSLAAPIARMVD